MATAKIERERFARGEGCLAKAKDDEPVFILRGQDCLASELVEIWAIRAQTLGVPWNKVREAKELAAEMERWVPRKNPD